MQPPNPITRFPAYPITRFIGLLVVIGTGACGAPPSEPVGRDVVVWRELATWSGERELQTESFLGDTGILRIRWEARRGTAAEVELLKVTLHSAVSGRPLAVAVEHKGPGADTAFVNEDPRVFYLVIEASGLEWTVAVDEGTPAVELPPGVEKQPE